MVPLNKLPFFVKRKVVDTFQRTVHGRRLTDWSRVPESLRELAKQNEYMPANPYPIEQIVQEFKAEPIVSQTTPIVTMGSCFAIELERWLRKNEYNCLKNVWGAVFTPQAFAEIIRYSFETETWNPHEPFWVVKGKYHNPYVKSNINYPVELGDNETEARAALQMHYAESAAALKQAKVVVWTLGLTELWRNKQDHATYFALPLAEVYDENKHEFYNLSYEDVVGHLRYAITTLKQHNPDIKIIFSVSPIPLHVSFRPELGPYVATQYSKSVLHAAAMSMTEQYDYVHYMPSYEIVRSNPLGNYQPDGRHVNQDCVDLIMQAFKRIYVYGP